MRTGGLNAHTLLVHVHTLLDDGNKGISKQKLIRLPQKIENDAKYGLDNKIVFNLIGRLNAKSLECIRQFFKKNLNLMNGEWGNFSIVFNRMWRLKPDTDKPKNGLDYFDCLLKTGMRYLCSNIFNRFLCNTAQYSLSGVELHANRIF